MSKILISAYACRPGYGSESGVGWSFASEVSNTHDVWVITRSENQKSIEDHLARFPNPRLHFIFQPMPWWVRVMFPGQAQFCRDTRYYIWQHTIVKTVKQWHEEIGFDLCHHVTWVRYWMPSGLRKLGIPFIWGPLGGGDSSPWTFWKKMGLYAKFAEAIRVTARWLGDHDPFVSQTANAATLACATTEATAKKLRDRCNCPTIILSEAGLTQREFDVLGTTEEPDDGKFRFISIGRLLHWKGFHLGLRAFAMANLKNARFQVVGDGPELNRLRNLARDLGIADRVDFTGRLPREETFVHLKKAKVLVHPSLHDSGGWVCLEAMAASKPVICLELGGPAMQVTEGQGFRVRADDPDQSVRDMALVMQQIYSDDALRERMGRSGRKHVAEEYLWDEKIRHINELYADLLGQRTARRPVPAAR